MIFISHSSKNHALAHAIADRLKDMRYAHFLDLADLHGGDRWEPRLDEALNQAQALVLCATPAALESTWVRQEVEMAIGLGIPVVPCALEHCEKRWPPELQWIDFTKDPDAGYKRLLAALERIPTLLIVQPTRPRTTPLRALAAALHAPASSAKGVSGHSKPIWQSVRAALCDSRAGHCIRAGWPKRT